MTDFNLCEHEKVQIILRAGAIIRELKGLPEENNITRLYEETAPILGVPVIKMNSRTADHLPSPAEMKDAKGQFIIPHKPCPKCGKESFLLPICQSCKDAEGGKYLSGYKCDEKSAGCGFIDDKTGEGWGARLGKMGIEVPTGTKESLGVKTITDEGLK